MRNVTCRTKSAWAALCPALIIVLVVSAVAAAEETREVKYGKVTLDVPSSWKESKPRSRLRLAQFALPGPEGTEDAELAIFNFGRGGSIQQNLARWRGQFEADGRTFKATSGNSATNGAYTFVDIGGTYKKPDGPPILQKTKPVAGSRMLGVIFAENGQGYFFLKLVGPADTIAAHEEAYRASFGAVEDTEKAVPEG